MNEALFELIGNEVEVRSNSGDDDCCDYGLLEAFDYPWIRIRKSEKDVLCFPVHNIRLIKVTKWLTHKIQKPEQVLLRPAGPEAPAIEPPD
jgi:hypothetical protein